MESISISSKNTQTKNNAHIQLQALNKAIEDTISKFNKKYFDISNMLTDMKVEFLSQMSIFANYLAIQKTNLECLDKINQSYSIKVPSKKLSPKRAKIKDYKSPDEKGSRNINNSKKNKTTLNTNVNTNTNNNTIDINKHNSPQYVKSENFSDKNLIIAIAKDYDDIMDKSKNKKGNAMKKPLNYSNLYSQFKKNKCSFNTKNSENSSIDKLSKTLNNNHKHGIIKHKNRSFKKNYLLRNSSSSSESKASKLKNYNANVLKALKICCNSNLFPFEEKLKMKFLNRNLYNYVQIKEQLKKSKKIIEERINKIKSISHAHLLKDKKYPSLTAQTNLNFMDIEKQNEFINCESDLNKKIIEIFYILVNKSNEFKSDKKCIELYSYLIQNFHVKNFKEFFIKIVFDKVFNNNEIDNEIWNNLTKIHVEIEEEITNLSKNPKNPFCWVYFSLTEMFEFLSLNFEDHNELLIEEYDKLKKDYNKIETILKLK